MSSSQLSSSIEETNRMRIAMGMAPLAVESSDDRAAASASASSAASAAAEAAERARTDAIRAELARRKEKRLVASRVMTQSLGESLVSQTAGSAREWIERSRKLGLTEAQRAAARVEREKAEAIARSADPSAYTSSDLAGVKVAHAASDFESGSDVILTLKDSRILAGVADDLNDEEDELLNTELTEREKVEANNQRKKNLKTGGGAGSKYGDLYGDEEAELLSKYSEAREKSGLRLGVSGTLTRAELELQQHREMHAQDEARAKLNQLVYSLGDDESEKERKVQSDFKEVKFKKKKKQPTAAAAATDATGATDANGDASMDTSTASTAMKKKKSSTRRTRAPTSSILDFLPEPSEMDRTSDLSSRTGGKSAMQLREEAEARQRQAEKDARYLRAIQNAEQLTQQRNRLDQQQAKQQAAAAQATSGSLVPPPPSSAPPASAFPSIPPPPPPPPAAVPALSPPPGLNLWEEEDDEVLAQSLERARRMAQKESQKKKENGATDKEEEPKDSIRALAEQVKLKREQDEIKVKVEPGLEESTDSTAAASSSSSSATAAARSAPPGMRVKKESDDNDGHLVFTATTEFVRGLQFDREAEEAERKRKAAMKKEGAATPAPATASSSSSEPADMEVDEVKEAKPEPAVTVEEGELHSDDEAGSVKAEGGEGSDAEESSDEEDSDDDDNGLGLDEPSASTGVAAALALFKRRGILKDGGNGRGQNPEDRFNLERYDAFGRPLSKKEQFRALSHKFHGMEPGLKKKEKRLRKVQEEAQRLQALRETGGVTSKIVDKIASSGSAHVVLDKNLTKALATGKNGEEEEGASRKRKKEAGPFAQFGFGKKRRGPPKKEQEQQEMAAAAAAYPPPPPPPAHYMQY